MAKQDIARRDFVKMGTVAAATIAMGGVLSACSSSEGGSGQQASSSSEAQQSSTSEAQNASTSSSETAASEAAAPSGAGKVLVAYYSAQGHTKRVAEVAADELGADLFEIVPQEIYSDDDLDWTNSSSRVSREHDDESLRDVPLVQTTPDGWADYDTVLIGYPIWWAIAGWPCDRFASDNDFTGKKVIPFCTSSSSGLGQSGELLADAAGTGQWQTGERFSSGASESEVRSWAAGI